MKDPEAFLEQIKKIKDLDILIIVEGIKDKAALQRLGLKNIITLKKPIYKIVEEVSENFKECIILTDLDKEGKKLYGKLNTGLSQSGVRIDNKFRNFLYRNTQLRQIEGLKWE